MLIKLVQLDGKLPNLALMKLSHWHKAQGDSVMLTRSTQPTMFEETPDVVYGSAIFAKSLPRVIQLQEAYPNAIVGGTGGAMAGTVETVVGVDEYEYYDYSVYPDYQHSIGFTQRGCRLNCGFCVVPKKEGRPRSLNTIANIWREGTPRNVVLLDNDFFGQPVEQWRARISELVEGNFRVSFNQGVNIRLVDDEAATALASVQYYDDQFKARRLYTAWDKLGDESIFMRGLARLQRAGIPPQHVMVYMLVGYAPNETLKEVMYRFQQLKEAGCKPFPMVYDRSKRELVAFQRWVIRRYHEFVPWNEYQSGYKESAPDNQIPLVVQEAWLRAASANVIE